MEPETAERIQPNSPIVVFKRFCEDAGQRNSGEGLGGREHISEQAYLDVRRANQTDIISVACLSSYLPLKKLVNPSQPILDSSYLYSGAFKEQSESISVLMQYFKKHILAVKI